MTEKELNDWFCSLSVWQKNHIAAKIAIAEDMNPIGFMYPNCFPLWDKISEERKQAIHDHCTDRHGMWIQEGGDAAIYSY